MKIQKFSIYIVLIMALSQLLVGCSTSRYVPIPTYITDTSKSYSADTVLNERFVRAFETLSQMQQERKETKVKETTQEKDSIVPHYDSTGKVTGEDHYHSKIKVIESSEVSSLKETISRLQLYKDSTASYRHQLDSLASIKNKVVPYYIKKDFNLVQKVLMTLGAIFGLVILLYLYAVAMNCYKKLRK